MELSIIASVFGLGILTAISPCPLATNIAAISFIGKQAKYKKHSLFAGLLYSLGRSSAYIALAWLIAFGALGNAKASRFLQEYMNEALGPILILLGMLLLGWINSTASIQIGGDKLQAKAKENALFWAFPIGALFALSFCPVSAGLFFGAMIPISIQQESPFVLSLFYGLGTALPVVFFALLMSFASSYLTTVFNGLTQLENWMRYLSGIAFILVGIYYSLSHIYEISF